MSAELAVIGVLAGCRLRESPRVRCVVADWKLAFDKVGSPPRATCSFEMDLFNEGHLATGARGVSVSLRTEGRTLVERLMNTASREPLWTIDLLPRRWAHASAYVVLEGEETRELEGFWRADLLGRFPEEGDLGPPRLPRQPQPPLPSARAQANRRMSHGAPEPADPVAA